MESAPPTPEQQVIGEFLAKLQKHIDARTDPRLSIPDRGRRFSDLKAFVLRLVQRQQKDQLDAQRYRTLRALRWNESPLHVVLHARTHALLGTDCPSDERLDKMLDELIAPR